MARARSADVYSGKRSATGYPDIVTTPVYGSHGKNPNAAPAMGVHSNAPPTHSGYTQPWRGTGYHQGQPVPVAAGPMARKTITPPQMVTPFAGPQGVYEDSKTRDQHPYVYTPIAPRSGRKSGVWDPQLDGPARPSIRMVNLEWYPWIGSSNRRAYDPQRATYSPFGSQDGVTWTFVEQPTQSDLEPPVAKVPPSGPHGVHTDIIVQAKTAQRLRLKNDQMNTGRTSRLANSPGTGFSYSAHTVHQGGPVRLRG